MADTPIPYYGYYFGNTIQEDPAQSQTAQQFLTALRQYDPNAYFQQGTQGGSDGSVPTWTIQYDKTKLPNGGAQNVDLNPNDYSPLYGEATGHGIQGTVNNTSGITTDPVYGRTTPTSNFTFPKDNNLDDILGPLLVASFGFGAPLLAGAMSGGALGGSAGLLAEQAAAPIVDGGAGVAGGGDLAGGLGAGAADELANGGQLVAGAPAASGASIALGNGLTSLGLPNSVSGLLGKIPGVISALNKLPGAGGVAGANLGGLLGGTANATPGATQDALTLLKQFYGDPAAAGAAMLAKQRRGLLYG